MALPFLLYRQGTKRGLAETDTAIVGRDQVVSPDSKVTALEKFGEIAHEEFVLKYSARKHNCVDGVVPAKMFGRMVQAGSDAALEGTRDFRRMKAPQSILDN